MLDLTNITEQQINEVFDSKSDITVTNMKPTSKIPSLWKVNAPGNNNLCIWLSNYQSKKDAFKQIKPGDKFAQLWFLSVSEKGNAETFKGGLGSDPIGVMNVVFDTVLDTVTKYNMDGVLLRFPIKKMQGKLKQLAKISSRIVQQRSGGKFSFLDEIVEHQTGRYAFMLFYRKSKGLNKIAALGLDSDIFKLETSKTGVGEVVVVKKTGEQISKAEAIARTVVNTASKQTEQQAAQRVPKLTSTEIIKAFSVPGVVNGNEPSNYDQFGTIEYDDSKVELERNLDASNHLSVAVQEKFISDLTSQKQKDVARELIDSLPGVELPGRGRFVRGDAKAIALAVKAAGKLPAYERSSFVEKFINSLRQEAIRKYHEFADTVKYSFVHSQGISAFSVTTYGIKTYDTINRVFTANEKPSDYTAQLIRSLDSAFKERGKRLGKGATLYRAMQTDAALINSSIKMRAFYFRNYVATSMQPIIFGTTSSFNIERWNVAKDSKSTLDLLSKQADVENSAAVPVIGGEKNAKVDVGFVINPMRVPCLPVGHTSENTRCEILMPRGTILRFKTVAVDGNKVVIEAEAEHESAIQEGAELFDGDALINEGVVKPFSFANFIAEQKMEQSENLTQTDLNMLCEVFDISDVPPQMIQ